VSAVSIPAEIPARYQRLKDLMAGQGNRPGRHQGDVMNRRHGSKFQDTRSGNTKQGKGRRFGLLLACVLAVLLVNPVASDAATRLSGGAYYDAVQCPGPPAGYEEFTTYPGLVMTGSLEGCLYTNVVASKETPSGVYLERGEEVFVGSLDGGPVGTFATTYRFESKWAPDVSSGVELHGRCQHPIVEGSGTGGFEGATGRLDIKDIIGDPVTYAYRGHINLS
jgi:hypothetical protein